MKKLSKTPEVVLDSVVVERVLPLLNEHMAGCESRPAVLGSGSWCGPAGQQSERTREDQERRACVKAI